MCKNEKPNTGIDDSSFNGIMTMFRQQALSCAAPLTLHENGSQTPMFNGTIGFVRGGEKYFFAVTAYHVYEKLKDPKYEGCISGCLFDFNQNIISINETLDIATFTIDESFVKKINKNFIQHLYKDQITGSWISRSPQEKKGVFFAGFPGVDRKKINKSHIEFGVFSCHGITNSVSDKTITIHMDEHFLIDDGLQTPENYNFGGVSGAPVFALYEQPILTWEFVGIIFEYSSEHSIFRIRPACLINEHGKIIGE